MATPRLRATLLQVKGFTRRVENILVPLGEVERTLDVGEGVRVESDTHTREVDSWIAQGDARDTGDSTCCYRAARVGLL